MSECPPSLAGRLGLAALASCWLCVWLSNRTTPAGGPSLLRIDQRYQRFEVICVLHGVCREFPDYNGDNWLLTCYAGFVDLGFLSLLA